MMPDGVDEMCKGCQVLEGRIDALQAKVATMQPVYEKELTRVNAKRDALNLELRDALCERDMLRAEIRAYLKAPGTETYQKLEATLAMTSGAPQHAGRLNDGR